ncbi:hypothetical protein [Blastococcus sp. SYSU D00820]
MLLSLGLTLRRDHSPDRRQHIAMLAGRLGYHSVWLPVDDATAADSAAELDALRAATTSRVGAVVDVTEAPRWLAAVAASRPDLLVEVDAPGDTRAEFVSALGGDRAWAERAFVRALDPTAAALVLAAAPRAALADDARRAVAARGVAVRPRIAVALGVSIGRTMSEAEARALRDLHLADPAARGSALFGTFEDAQEQVLQLAAAGVGFLRLNFADEHDVADLLAQFRAVVTGPTPVLHAAAQRRALTD